MKQCGNKHLNTRLETNNTGHTLIHRYSRYGTLSKESLFFHLSNVDRHEINEKIYREKRTKDETKYKKSPNETTKTSIELLKAISPLINNACVSFAVFETTR